MRSKVLLAFLFSAALATAQSNLHLPKMRSVSVPSGAKQVYIVPDQSVWRGARADLGDLRLMSGDTEVPYVLQVQAGSSRTGSTPVKLFNKGAVGEKTQFVLDVNLPEYDELVLTINKKDFVTRAKVEAADDLSATKWIALGEYTIFDFSKEQLGASTNIRIRSPVRYRFVRVEIESGVPPDDVRSAAVANRQVDKARYRDAISIQNPQQQGKRTIFPWSLDKKVPVDRVAVEVNADQVNFSRSATLFCGDQQQAQEEISRVHLQRRGRTIHSENLSINSDGTHCTDYRLEIDNGDNPPLQVTAIKAQTLERRLYFNAPMGSVALFYGYEKLNAPVYDLARFFEATPEATEAQLGPEEQNPRYQIPPDDRPWSERHPAVLWIVLLAVVAALGTVAMRSLTK